MVAPFPRSYASRLCVSQLPSRLRSRNVTFRNTYQLSERTSVLSTSTAGFVATSASGTACSHHAMRREYRAETCRVKKIRAIQGARQSDADQPEKGVPARDSQEHRADRRQD